MCLCWSYIMQVAIQLLLPKVRISMYLLDIVRRLCWDYLRRDYVRRKTIEKLNNFLETWKNNCERWPLKFILTWISLTVEFVSVWTERRVHICCDLNTKCVEHFLAVIFFFFFWVHLRFLILLNVIKQIIICIINKY